MNKMLFASVLGLSLVACLKAPEPVLTTTITARASSLNGQPIGAVNISIVGQTSTASTSSTGEATLTTTNDQSITLKFQKTGFADQFKVVNLPKAASSASIEAVLLERQAPQTLPDISKGGALLGKDGAKAEFPAGSLVDKNGNVVTGTVQMSLTPVNVLSETEAFPGTFTGLPTTGGSSGIVSFGTAEYVPMQNGEKLQVAPGKKVTIEIPIYADRNKDGTPVVVGQVIPLWSLNEQTALWTQEGTGTVVANPSSKTGLALRAEVSHFSWWNCDDITGPETRINLTCSLPGNAPLPAGQTCTVSAVVPDSSRRPVQQAVETFGANGLPNVRVPADTNVNLIANSGSLFGFKTINLPVSPTPVDVNMVMRPRVNVSITQPSSEGTTLTASSTVIATAASAVTGLELFVGDTSAGVDNTAPYEFTLNTTTIPEGFQNLQVRALQSGDVVGLSDRRGVVIDRSPPIVTLSRLEPSLGDGVVRLLAQIQDISSIGKVEFFKGSTKLGEDSSFPYKFDYTLTSADTPDVTFTAKATDAVNNEGISSNLVIETIAPSISLSRNPSVPTLTSSQTVAYTANASDASGMARVEFFKGTILLGSDSSAPFEQAYTVTGADEPSLNVTAKAFDNNGNTASASSSLAVNISANDPVPPSVALDAIASPVTTKTLELSASASDNIGVAKVEFYAGTTFLGESTTLQTGKYRKTVNVENLEGSILFVARAFDGAGNTAESSQAVNVQIIAVNLAGGNPSDLFSTFDFGTCGPRLAFDNAGTAHIIISNATATATKPKGIFVYKLVDNAWQKILGGLPNGDLTEGRNINAFFGRCPKLVFTSTNQLIAGVQTIESNVTNPLITLWRLNGSGVWNSIATNPRNLNSMGNMIFDLAADNLGNLIVAWHSANSLMQIVKFDSSIANPTNADFTVLVSSLRQQELRNVILAVSPNNTIYALGTEGFDIFGTRIFVNQIVGTQMTSLGIVDSIANTAQSIGIFDLDVDSSQVIVTYSKAVNGPNTFFTAQFSNNTWQLLGSAADQPALLQGINSSLQNGSLVQTLMQNGTGSKVRRWNGSAWGNSFDLPVSAVQVNFHFSHMVTHNNQVFLAYPTNNNGTLVARINAP